MKLNRLLEITTILLNRKLVTAAELAERFDVSVRTIYRDIDVLSASGVPVYTTQGQGGGISLMEGYSMHKTLLTDTEKESILFALQTLQSTKYPEVDLILEKLGSIFQNEISDWITVDFSNWGSDPNAYNKFLDIKNAIFQNKVIVVEYIDSKNQRSTRRIQPMRLHFKYQAWYLWGWCQERQDYRTFRISRIKKVSITEEGFDRTCKPDSRPQEDLEDIYACNSIHCVLQVKEDALYRVFDDYDENAIEDNGDGTYNVTMEYPEDEWVYGYILSFGPNAKVLAPEYLKNIIKERSLQMYEAYL